MSHLVVLFEGFKPLKEDFILGLLSINDIWVLGSIVDSLDVRSVNSS